MSKALFLLEDSVDRYTWLCNCLAGLDVDIHWATTVTALKDKLQAYPETPTLIILDHDLGAAIEADISIPPTIIIRANISHGVDGLCGRDAVQYLSPQHQVLIWSMNLPAAQQMKTDCDAAHIPNSVVPFGHWALRGALQNIFSNTETETEEATP